MSTKGRAYIVGAFEHPARKIPDKSTAQIHKDVAIGALSDAGLQLSDVDAFFCDGTLGSGPISLADYLGLRNLSYVESTYTGGSSYLLHVGHAMAAISTGKCNVALITLAGRPRSTGTGRPTFSEAPEYGFEEVFGASTLGLYALVARRHMYEFGTTSAQLAEIRVAASHHAQYNPHALLQNKVTVEEVLDSPLVSDPLRRLDCCVTTDGGGALVLVSRDIAKELPRQCIQVLGHGEGAKHTSNGRIDLTYSAAIESGRRAFVEAGVEPGDIDYVSIYDSFTITVLQSIEDLGFCEKGQGGAFVSDGSLQAPFGRLPFNTDGGGLCNNHPARRGGMTKVIEAVRQLRGEANPEVQVPDCQLALAHGTGGSLGTRHVSATLILGNEDA